jgi:hypothetical protein
MQPEPTTHQLADLASLSDRDLATTVLETLTSPPAADADSFVLHAPLELMARAELLPSVEPSHRGEARQRIVDIADEWTSHTPHEPPPTARPTLSLPEAITAGDLADADRALGDIATQQTIDQFVTTAGNTLLGHLGGAGHLAIFLDQLTRQHRPSPALITSGRALVRDLARHPDWTIRWVDAAPTDNHRPAKSFLDILADPPSAGDPGSNFIYPTMHLVDANGMGAELLTAPTQSMPVDEARRQLLRIAAMSMLQDDPANAPYGWSHCLTMPQAVLAVAPRTADPRRAIGIAATYVLGFRSTLSSTPLDLGWSPSRPNTRGRLLDAECNDAIARAWHTDEPRSVETELATYAATHHDAHLAKYTLACLHAANTDPDDAPLFRAAATRLAIWWRDDARADLEQGDHHHDD